MQNLVIVLDEDIRDNADDILKLTIPKNVRNLYVSSNINNPVKIELDCVNHKGLERVVIGHINVSDGDDPSGFGGGNFIVENLDGLEGCTNLKEIYINSAEINDISELVGLENFRIVELQHNRITDISSLAITRL